MKTRALIATFATLQMVLALPVVSQEDSSGTLTIIGLLTVAEIANPALQSAALQLENSRVTYDRSIASSDARLDRISADLQWSRAQLTYRQTTVSEILSLAETYVGLQQANENLSLLVERNRLAQLEMTQAADRVEIGAASPVTELQARVTALNSELNLAGARNTRQFTTLPDLADATGIGIGTLNAATLTSQPPVVYQLDSLETYLKTTEDRAEQAHAARQLQIDQLNLKLKSMQSTSQLDLQTATNTVTSSQANVEKIASELQLATASAYASAQQAIGNVTLRELQLDLQQENTRRTKEQFKAGLLTELELATSQADLAGTHNALRAARWAAYFASVRLHNTAGTDVLEIWENR